ncbi:MAG: hypothetical protein ACLSUW_00245 [Akkermansia sp.]
MVPALPRQGEREPRRGPNHISLTRPDLMKRNGSVLMNPSASASRDHAMKVILDVVPLRHRRVHLDDYFYLSRAGRSWTPAASATASRLPAAGLY